METPNHSTLDVLEQLKASFSDYDDLKNILPTLVECFEREEDANILAEIISLVLGPAVQALPLQDLDHVILHPFLPLVKNYVSKAFSVIHKVLNQNLPEDSHSIPEITQNLEICVQVLTDIDNLLCHIASLNHVTLCHVFSIPRNVADLIYQVFVHCQQSKAEYGEVFTLVRKELMCLFQKCYKVQLNLFNILNEKLTFNCTFENQLQLLVDVLDILSSMAEVVADLDTMSLVVHWKGYAQLTQSYATDLCSRLDVARPINYLAVNITHQLNNLNPYLRGENKVIVRSLKISSLQLKVLIKLCEHYKGYLGDCHVELLNCLIFLTAHTSQHLSQQGVAADITAQITTLLSAGAAPLLTHLICDPAFVKLYLQYADNLNSRPVTTQAGYCYLTSLVLKKLVQLCPNDDEIQDVWLKSEFPSVKTVLKILHQGSTSAEVFSVYEDDIYQTLLVNTAVFLVTTCTSEVFPHLAELLIGQLLQPFLWTAFFTSDLLCLIARFGSSQLCLQLTSLLSDILVCWPAWDWNRPEWVYISWTQGRLIQLLSSNHLQALPLRFPTLASDITNVFQSTPFSDQTVKLFQTMIEKFTLYGDNMVLLSCANQALAEALYQLWQCMTVPHDAESTESSNWFLGFFSILVTATISLIDLFDNCRIAHVLDVLTKASSLKTTLFHCSACEFLKSLATKMFANDSNQSSVCRRISLLFVQLLQSNNAISKQVALETFSYFAYITKYEQIVADTVAIDCRLQAEITAYLEGVPLVISKTSLSQYIKCLCQNFTHKCRVKNYLGYHEFEEPEQKPCKKMKTSLDEELVSAVLNKIEKNVSLLEERRCVTAMSPFHLSTLQDIVQRLDQIIKTS